eukprot:CAMPEP_0184974638 /NCGR_PEP_ID=MMETSP1098-20130426/6075_1 /TAXON_ID=89044 /ORGANISM="Spumella elongata, Strain CCAP 955/1" /LENGTH=817 /DNA_ID=CAMNT_0027497251 /DNA_START=49 /DNA_END=2502 /DNA_ORIENTATION=+
MHFVFALLLLVAHAGFNARADDHVDWSAFEVQAMVNGQENLDIIRKLPIQQYWDVQKGSFRSGLIGETISSEFPQFVSHVERKVIKGGRVLGADSHVVDTTSLFMCSLSAAQELIRMELELSTKHGMFSYSRDADNENTDDNVGFSLEDLVVQQQALHAQDAHVQQRAANNKLAKEYAAKVLGSRKSFKLARLSEVHTNLLAAQRAHLSSLNNSRVDKFCDLSTVAENAELARRLQKQEYLAAQHEADVQALRQTINTTMQAVAFRAAAEVSAAQAQRAFEEGQLLATRTELLQAEVETLIDTFFEEMYGYVAYVQANPAVAVLVGRNTLIGVFLILLVFELGNLILLVCRKLSTDPFLPKVVSLNRSFTLQADRDNRSPILVWAPSADQQLCRALDAVSAATTHRLPLPNLLVSGPAGSGKSSMCQAILQHIAHVAASSNAPMSSLMVCGADLQALGNGTATGFLNDLIGKYSRRRCESLVLVIDDADGIVAARDRDQGQDRDSRGSNPNISERQEDGAQATAAMQGVNSNGSLFALLTGLRENSPFVSIVMTVRLPVRSLDTAVLDRLDHCIELSLPSPQQRLLSMVGGLSVLKEKTSTTPTMANSSLAAAERRHSEENVWIDWAMVETALSGMTDDRTRAEMAAQLLRQVTAVDPERSWGITSSSIDTSSNTNSNNRNTSSSSSNNRMTGSVRSCPEIDLPEEDRTARSGGQGGGGAETGAAAWQMMGTAGDAAYDDSADTTALLALLRACIARAPAGSFQALPCLKLALLVSAGWSYRDLKQLISALNYTILCSDRCQMSNQIWLQELIYSLE